MKTHKVIVLTSRFAQVLEFDRTFNLPKKEWISQLKGLNMFKDERILNIYDGRKYHICPYCGSIADGMDKETLCDECYELFGHMSINEL